MSVLVAWILAWLGFGPPAPAGPPQTPPAVEIALPESHEGPLPAVTPARGEDPPLVLIDPGHGGRDPGAPAEGGRLHEKQVTLALAIALRDELAASGRVRAALTREDDRFIELPDRYRIAQRLGADLFISIHADAAPENSGARGATVYTLSEVASDRETQLLAQRENEAGAPPGLRVTENATVNHILTDLAQRESMAVSADFARLIHREASPLFRFQPNWHRFAAFIVLKAPDVPSLLFESGYMTNPEDVAYLTSAEGRRDIATGLRRAIEAHFARQSGRARAAL